MQGLIVIPEKEASKLATKTGTFNLAELDLSSDTMLECVKLVENQYNPELAELTFTSMQFADVKTATINVCLTVKQVTRLMRQCEKYLAGDTRN